MSATQQTAARWYMVDKDGMATLCTDMEDAEKEAKDANMAWPHTAPHRAVQLVEVGTSAAELHHSPPEGMVGGWQSIETAPKDSGYILLRGGREQDVASGYWLQAAYAGNGAWIWPFVHMTPRFWAPLPPTTSAGSGKGGVMADRITPAGLVEWLAGGSRGISSNTIVQHLTGWPALADWRPDIPHDPADLDRCLQLLAQVPMLRPLMPRMATCTPMWAALMERWDEIEACHLEEVGLGWAKAKSAPKTYDLMRSVIDAARKKDPS